MRRIAENAGHEGSVVVENIRQAQAKEKSNKFGFNVLDEKYTDMVKAGVIDPAKVTRGALENATSIAAMILTTEALITDVPEPGQTGRASDAGILDRQRFAVQTGRVKAACFFYLATDFHR